MPTTASKRAVWTRADGGVSVVHPDDSTRLPGETEDDWLNRIADLFKPPGVTHRLVLLADLPGGGTPAGRRFRSAWQDTGSGPVTVHMPRARLIRRRELLELREARLAIKTALLEKAVDNGQTALAAMLRADRVTLRALDDTLDASLAAQATPEALDAFVPPELA